MQLSLGNLSLRQHNHIYNVVNDFPVNYKNSRTENPNNSTKTQSQITYKVLKTYRRTLNKLEAFKMLDLAENKHDTCYAMNDISLNHEKLKGKSRNWSEKNLMAFKH